MDDINFVKEDAIGKRILDAAIQIIEEEGYDNLKIRKVASVSGCSNSAIYTRFEDKDALCKAIAKMHAEPVYQLITEVYRPENDLLTNLQRMARAEMEIFYAMDLDSLIMQMKFRGADSRNPFSLKIEECIKIAEMKGEIKVKNVIKTAFDIEAAFWGFVFMIKSNPNYDFETVSKMMNEYIATMFKSIKASNMNIDIWEELKNKGVNVDKALERLKGNKNTYKEFLIEFFEEPDFESLEDSINNREIRKAFEYAHGLKGMAANLGLDKVLEPLTTLVEVLRAGSLDGASELLEQILVACRDISNILYCGK